ncbi:MAG: hypothetical protein HY769_08710, partial [Candidatus Stahlbacteria bacterium]|nr:hypothetical protein [Candidatus Stahlbacteria bacterium]
VHSLGYTVHSLGYAVHSLGYADIQQNIGIFSVKNAKITNITTIINKNTGIWDALQTKEAICHTIFPQGMQSLRSGSRFSRPISQ